MSEYSATMEGATVIDGVEVDITVRGNEDRAEKTYMELQEHLGRIAAAFDQEVSPQEAEPEADQVPILSVNWDSAFDDD